MKLKITQILTRLGELKRSAPPSRSEVASATGISLQTVTKLFSIPHTRLSSREMQLLTKYLFEQFRPHVSTEVSDTELLNRLRFELIEFEGGGSGASTAACPYSADGKLALSDIFPAS